MPEPASQNPVLGEIRGGNDMAVVFEAMLKTAALDVPDEFKAWLTRFFGAAGEVLSISGVTGLKQATVPVGALFMWGAATAPDFYLLCDGAAVSRTTYAALFATIGTTYGVGDGSTTFNLPNLKGRVPVGLDAAQAEFDTLAETGGAKTLPAHTHSISSDGSHQHGPSGGTNFALDIVTSAIYASGGIGALSSWAASMLTASAGAHTHGGATGSTGTGSHGVLQPYLVLNYIVRAL